MMKIKIIFLTMLTLLLLTPLVLSEEANVGTEDLKNFIIKDSMNTVKDVNQHIDLRINGVMKDFQTQGQAWVDENFLAFDERVHALANKMLVKLCIGIFSTILFSQLVWLLIRRELNKRRKKREMIKKKKEQELDMPILSVD